MCVALCYAFWVVFQAMAYIFYYLAVGMLWLIWFIVRLPFLIAAALLERR